MSKRLEVILIHNPGRRANRFFLASPGIFVFLFLSTANAGEASSAVEKESLKAREISRFHPQYGYVFRFPVYDYPFNNSDGYTAPSMRQSLELTKNGAQAAHWALDRQLIDIGGKAAPLLSSLSIALFDLLNAYLPFGYSWLHEEFHRAVLSRRGIESYNEVYEFEFFTEAIAVSGIEDQALIGFKRRYPAEMVRLASAGYESEIELVNRMKRESFFYSIPGHLDLISYWYNIGTTVSYIHITTTSEADRTTERLSSGEGDSIGDRDALGLDFLAWVYDLHRPDEPYEQRGVHPGGIGVDRYILRSDLTDEEKKYLKLQSNLSFINFLSPFILGFTEFHTCIPEIYVIICLISTQA